MSAFTPALFTHRKGSSYKMDSKPFRIPIAAFFHGLDEAYKSSQFGLPLE